MVMESSEEDEEYVAHEWITPQSSVSAAYQSHAEKVLTSQFIHSFLRSIPAANCRLTDCAAQGIRRLCSELLELKDAVEHLCGNMQSKYLSFLR